MLRGPRRRVSRRFLLQARDRFAPVPSAERPTESLFVNGFPGDLRSSTTSRSDSHLAEASSIDGKSS